MKVVTDILFLDSKITADGDCSHEIRRQLLLGRKALTNLDSVLKGRDITLLTEVCKVKAMVLPVVTYGCESWMVKKAEGGKGRRCNQRKTGEASTHTQAWAQQLEMEKGLPFSKFSFRNPSLQPKDGIQCPLPKRVRKTSSECGLNSRSPFSGAVPIKLNLKSKEHQRTDTFKMWCWKRLLRVLGLQGDQTSQS